MAQRVTHERLASAYRRVSVQTGQAFVALWDLAAAGDMRARSVATWFAREAEREPGRWLATGTNLSVLSPRRRSLAVRWHGDDVVLFRLADDELSPDELSDDGVTWDDVLVQELDVLADALESAGEGDSGQLGRAAMAVRALRSAWQIAHGED